jgi:putative transposase
MPNHVHLITVPDRCDGLARAIGQAHLRYTRHINEREGWLGYLWQGRFASFVMDEGHVLAAMRYVAGSDDPLVGNVRDMINYVGDWKRYLALDGEEEELLRLRKHARTGRPLGDATFIQRLDQSLGRPLIK